MALTKDQIVEAWKSEEYRNSLSDEDRAALPSRPTGADGGQLTDEQLEQAAGGITPATPGIASAAVAGAAVSKVVKDNL